MLRENIDAHNPATYVRPGWIIYQLILEKRLTFNCFVIGQTLCLASICGQCNVGLVFFSFVYCEAFILVYCVVFLVFLQYCIGSLVCFYLIFCFDVAAILRNKRYIDDGTIWSIASAMIWCNAYMDTQLLSCFEHLNNFFLRCFHMCIELHQVSHYLLILKFKHFSRTFKDPQISFSRNNSRRKFIAWAVAQQYLMFMRRWYNNKVRKHDIT